MSNESESAFYGDEYTNPPDDDAGRVYRCDGEWLAVTAETDDGETSLARTRCHRAARINRHGESGAVEQRLCLDCFAATVIHENIRYTYIAGVR